MRILLFSLELKEEAKVNFRMLAHALLTTPDIEVFHHSSTSNDDDPRYDFVIPRIHSKEELLAKKIDIIITAGGDGTMLKAAAFAGSTGIPFLGFNLGRLGFLAVIEKESIQTMIYALKSGNYTIEKRVTLKLTASPNVFEHEAFALNDFTLVKRDHSSMIRIHAIMNGEYLNTYWADGIILATPTGSTGYSLSCGGPIVFPQSSNFVLTPIAPHNLNVRPIIISDDAVLEFKVEGRTDNFLCTLDSNYGLVTSDHKIILQKNNFHINLLRIEGFTFLKTLRNKLMWGLDQRN